MDIRPYYTDHVGQSAVMAEPTRKAGWNATRVTNGLMLSWPLSGFGEERPEIKGQDSEVPDRAGVMPLQVE